MIIRSALAAAALLCASSAAFAMDCTDKDMMGMSAKVDAMGAGDSKTMAMDHMKMAKDAMEKKDTAGCAKHMGDAMQAMDAKAGAMDKMDKMDKK